MSPFDILLIGHLIGDYLFQTSWMAANKAKKWSALLTHSFVYTLAVAVVAWIGFGGLSVWGILLVFGLHVFFDRRTFVAWWVRTIMTSTGKESGWLSIIVDQTFHLITLWLALMV
ncbi:DUF3307 domain-containing protein [Bacillus sp. Marseille-P3661]|uniref:DUF3307 domain-containing protein n=1 Tax=Bacillus sp. Marseille-P3661 TaxID=1936234 RepID=UPI000C85A4B0|nr:DUF3307 domain-containing protein [Bacillus sp. Marseille-P3661]